MRQVLSHKTVNRAVIVDIDEQVVALSRQYLANHSQGAFEDARTELYHVDARDYLARSGKKFDIIIIDLPDPLEKGPAYLLYTREFYQIVRDRLTAGGMIAVQAGSASLTELLSFTAVNNTLKSVFPVVSPYKADIPCFGGPWGFCVASLKRDPARLSPREVDKRIDARSISGLKSYDGLTHQGMFSLPKYIRNALVNQSRIVTDKNPLYLNTG